MALIGAGLAFGASCSDTEDASSPGTGGSTAQGGGGGAANGVSVTFYVGESIWGDANHPPIAGATVAFDAPGGERTELTTGADGKVTFDGVDWSLGLGSVTAYGDGHAMYSVVGLDAARVASLRLIDGGVFLALPTLPGAVDTVTVSGTITGFQDAAHNAVVNVVGSMTGSEWSGASSGTFSVMVPSGVPFTLQALEMTQQPLASGQGYDMPVYQVSHHDFAATSSDVSGAVLDLSTSTLALQTADVSWTTPSRAESRVRAGFGVGLVCPWGSTACTGWSTHIDISAGGNQFDDSLLWVEPTWAETPTFFARVYDGNELISFRRSMGWPQGGFVGSLPDTPEWVTPSAGTHHPLHESLSWQLFDTGVPEVMLMMMKGATLAWVVSAGADATSLAVPELPSTVDSAALLGLAPRAYVVAGWPNDDLESPDAFGASKTVFLDP
ncbi:MAG: hypothetical protein IT373_08360 [Polyangiaceae bacterium]|nr:hypothetical protein [Polyangiaceae bacterium]